MPNTDAYYRPGGIFGGVVLNLGYSLITSQRPRLHQHSVFLVDIHERLMLIAFSLGRARADSINLHSICPGYRIIASLSE
jgi:hypothetical protein